MKVIYHCYGSSHSSVVAAAIHLRWLPSDRIPESREILGLPHYDRTDPDQIGTCFLMGTDEAGREVYIIGMGAAKGVVRRAIESIFQICGVSRDEYMLVDTLPNVGLVTKIGGFLSRAVGLIGVGRPLTVWGVRRSYPKFVQLVQGVRRRLDDAGGGRFAGDHSAK
ncbi:MAG: DUF3189 family protein [Bacillota bacterium]|nr:DUF3189 family protein [Bacillota bacterium]